MTSITAHHHDHDKEISDKVLFGFWTFIMSDCLLFAVLFISYAVLHNNTFGGASIKDVASLPYVLVQTLVLLTSCLSFGFSLSALHKGSRAAIIFWLLVTFVLGAAFVFMGYQQLAHLVATGNSWQRSAFLSTFFVLIALHATNIVAGLLWIVILIIQFLQKNITSTMKTRLACFGLFWHFLTVVWLLVFVIVYLMGAI